MSIGENIRKMRKDAGLTMEQLAGEVGLSAAAIGNYERGDREPKSYTVKKIATALGTSVSELILGSEEFSRNAHTISLTDYTTDELLKEVFRRVGGSL